MLSVLQKTSVKRIAISSTEGKFFLKKVAQKERAGSSIITQDGLKVHSIELQNVWASFEGA